MRAPPASPATDKATIGARPMMAVTERSNAPAMISTVMPAAPIPRMAVSFSTASRLLSLKKLGAAKARNRRMTTFRIQTPLRSRRMRRRRRSHPMVALAPACRPLRSVGPPVSMSSRRTALFSSRHGGTSPYQTTSIPLRRVPRRRPSIISAMIRMLPNTRSS